MKKFGLQAEGWMVELLKRNGVEVRRATRVEDRVFKVDFWVRYGRYWLPIQFSLDRRAITSWKGLDSLRRGIIPMWMDGTEVEVAYSNGNGTGIVKEFWSRLEKVLTSSFPVKRFRTPHWRTRTLR